MVAERRVTVNSHSPPGAVCRKLHSEAFPYPAAVQADTLKRYSRYLASGYRMVSCTPPVAFTCSTFSASTQPAGSPARQESASSSSSSRYPRRRPGSCPGGAQLRVALVDWISITFTSLGGPGTEEGHREENFINRPNQWHFQGTIFGWGTSVSILKGGGG